MTGRERLCTALYELGVRQVFGLPGTQNAELFNLFPEHDIRPVLATHEGSAAFMANGYARTSGQVAVLVTIPGPGFTFAFPGLAEARLDSVPLLHIVGTPATEGGTRFQHQAIEQARMAQPLVKAVVEVQAAEEMGPRVREAHALALGGEPGPVVLHVSPGAMDGNVGSDAAPSPSRAREPASVEPAWGDELLRRMQSAVRPVLFVGGGALRASSGVRQLAEVLRVPVFTTLTGRGVLPEDHALALAFDADRGGLGVLNQLLAGSDLILALGCKMAHNGTAGFGLRLPEETLVHVNVDPLALGPNYPASLQIEADAGFVLAWLLNRLEGSASSWTAEEVEMHRAGLSTPQAPRLPEPEVVGVDDPHPAAFFEALRAVLPRDGILVTDAGLHQVLARRYFQVLGPGGMQAPADFQSMGFGLPAALGAKLATPDRAVVAVIGDGGLLMSGMDLLCAAREHIPVVVVVFNDGHLNLIRLQQIKGHGRPSGVKLLNPDLETLAEAFGISYGLVTGDPRTVLRAALDSDGPALVEVRLGDSADIRSMRSKGATRHFVRRTLGKSNIDRIKALLGRG